MTNVIDYITIATLGNSTDFGDVASVARRGSQACTSSTRCTFGGGTTPTNYNTIDYVTIASTGNSSDFGDMTATTKNPAGCSDVHGGLGD